MHQGISATRSRGTDGPQRRCFPSADEGDRATSRSDPLPFVTSRNAGRQPSWSSPMCSFNAPFVLRYCAQGNSSRHRSTYVASSENSLLRNRKPCPGAAFRHRASRRPNNASYSSWGCLSLTRASDDRGHPAHAKVVELVSLRVQVRHDVAQAAPPGKLGRRHRYELAPAGSSSAACVPCGAFPPPVRTHVSTPA